MLYKKIAQLMLSLACLLPLMAHSTSTTKPVNLYDQHPWSLTYYYANTYSNSLLKIVTLQGLERWPEHIQTVELAKTLAEDNFLRQLVSPLVSTTQLAGNITVRNGRNQQNPIYEFDPYLLFRWSFFPWNDYINTSLAIGEGVSYVSHIPSLEQKDNARTKHLLNFLALEATFALPKHPELQLVARVHHRSGAFGLYHAGNTGSNDLGIGIRYLFD